MRRFLLLLLAFACCTRGADDLAMTARPLSRPLSARLANLHEVAHGGALEPRLSPDGQWVGFTGIHYRGIRIAPAVGGEAVLLTDEPGAGFRFAWSNDASQIAYVTREEDGSRLLRLIARDGGAAQTVHRAAQTAPLPLPRFDEAGELSFIDVDRLRVPGRAQPITGPLPAPRLAAQARTGDLLIAGDHGIFVAGADGSDARPLFEGTEFFELAASPDGSVVLARALKDGVASLWSLDRASGKKTLLDGYDRGCVLPSGLVVAERLEGDGLRFTRGELWLMRADGSGAIKLEGAPGAVHYRVDCAQKMERIAVGDDATDSVFVADVEVSR
jgi:hypothetical protein